MRRPETKETSFFFLIQGTMVQKTLVCLSYPRDRGTEDLVFLCVSYPRDP